jgi:tetratricopeptide (TPR) repeat protein
VLERGIELAEQLQREFPGNPHYSAILVDLANNLDSSRSTTAAAEPDRLEGTLERARRAAQTRPDSPEYQFDLAMSLNNHGVNLEEAGRLTEALEVYTEGLDVCQALVHSAPQAAIYRDLLVRILCNLGDVHAALGRDDQAEASYRQAATEVEPLITSTDEALLYRFLQAETTKRLQLFLRKLRARRRI